MKEIFPSNRQSKQMTSNVDNPITEQQYQDLVCRTNTAVECAECAIDIAEDVFNRTNGITNACVNKTSGRFQNLETNTVSADTATVGTVTSNCTNTDNLTVSNSATIAGSTFTDEAVAIQGVALENGKVTAGTVETNSLDANTVNAGSVIADCLTVACPMTFNGIEVTGNETVSGNISTSVVNAEVSCIGTANVTCLNGQDATIQNVEVENAEVDVVDINTIIHKQDKQYIIHVANTGDYYILLPQFTNGFYYLEAQNNAGTKLFSIEIANSIDNVQFRWSQSVLGKILDFKIVKDSAGISRVQIHANTQNLNNTIYWQSQSTNNISAPTHYDTDQLPEYDYLFNVTTYSGTWVQDIIFTNKLHADELEMDSIAVDEVGVCQKLNLFDHHTCEGGIYKAILCEGEEGQYVANKLGEDGSVHPMWNTPVTCAQNGILSQSNCLISEKAVSEYNGTVGDINATCEGTYTKTNRVSLINKYIFVDGQYKEVTNQKLREQRSIQFETIGELKDAYDNGLLQYGTHYVNAVNVSAGTFTYYDDGEEYSVRFNPSDRFNYWSYETLLLEYDSEWHEMYPPIDYYSVVVNAAYPIVHLGDCACVHGNANVECKITASDAEVTCSFKSSHIGDGQEITNGIQLITDSNGTKIYRKEDTTCCEMAVFGSVCDGQPAVYNCSTNAFDTSSCLNLSCLDVDELTVQCDAHIKGDLRVDGTMYVVDEEEITSSSDMLTLRANKDISLGSDKSGILINKYDGTKSQAVVTCCDGVMRIGDGVTINATYPNLYLNLSNNKYYTDEEMTVEVTPNGSMTKWDTYEKTETYKHWTNAVFSVIDFTHLDYINCFYVKLDNDYFDLYNLTSGYPAKVNISDLPAGLQPYSGNVCFRLNNEYKTGWTWWCWGANPAVRYNSMLYSVENTWRKADGSCYGFAAQGSHSGGAECTIPSTIEYYALYRCDLVSNLQPLATRREENLMCDNGLTKWNCESSTLETISAPTNGTSLVYENDAYCWKTKGNAETYVFDTMACYTACASNIPEGSQIVIKDEINRIYSEETN